MAISVTTNKIDYTGNGATTAFAFDFKVESTAQLEAYVNGALNVDWTATLNDGEGGTLTFNAAPANAAKIRIRRVLTLEQQTEIDSLSVLPEEALESAYDRAVMMIQQLQEQLNRALKFSKTSLKANYDIPEPSAGKALKWNDDATALENSDSDFDDIVADATAQADAAEAAAAAADVSETNAASSASAAATSATSAANSATAALAAAAFVKVTKTYADFQTGALTNTLTVRSLAAGKALIGVVVKHSTAFAGTSITDVKVSIGITGDDGRFIADFDVDTAASDTNFESAFLQFIGSFGSGTNITITMTAVGANLSALTAGSVDVYLREATVA